MNVTCPSCQIGNAYILIVNETGAHYLCPDCDFEWSDSGNAAYDEDDEDDEEELKQFMDCPNCSKAGNRFVYQCNNCEFTGCYDEYHGKGCFEDGNHMVACPKCNKCDYEIVGKIGTGWDEKFNP